MLPACSFDVGCWEALVLTQLTFAWRVNAALALPVRMMSPLNTSLRKQHNDLQVEWRSARAKREQQRDLWKDFNSIDCRGSLTINKKYHQT